MYRLMHAQLNHPSHAITHHQPPWPLLSCLIIHSDSVSDSDMMAAVGHTRDKVEYN
jgi:hypothetical protein